MVQGYFTGDLPIVKIDVLWEHALQSPLAILDTGFTGDVLITPQIAKDLGLEVSGVTNARNANGDISAVYTSRALVEMEGSKNFVQVLIADSFPLIGINFLTKFGYTAIVDCKARTLMLENRL